MPFRRKRSMSRGRSFRRKPFRRFRSFGGRRRFSRRVKMARWRSRNVPHERKVLFQVDNNRALAVDSLTTYANMYSAPIGVPQGVGYFERVGRSIFIRHISMKFLFASCQRPMWVGVLVFRPVGVGTAAIPPQLSDFVTSVGLTSIGYRQLWVADATTVQPMVLALDVFTPSNLNVNLGSQIRIMYFKRKLLMPDTGRAPEGAVPTLTPIFGDYFNWYRNSFRHFKFRFRYNRPVRYIANQTSAFAAPQRLRDHIFVVPFAQSIAGGVVADYNTAGADQNCEYTLQKYLTFYDDA